MSRNEPVVVLNLYFVPESIGDPARALHRDHGRLLTRGEAESNPFLHHSKRDEIVLPVEAAVVEEETCWGEMGDMVWFGVSN